MEEEKPISATEKLTALDRVLGSSTFDGSERLKSFLSYVVRRKIDDEDAVVRGKQILKDVYEKDVEVERNSEAVVRVDASRLRQKLEVYYSGEGRNDPVRILINKGGYSPLFVQPKIERRSKPTSRVSVGRPVLLGVAAAIFAAFGIGTYFVFQSPSVTDASSVPLERREALFESAPTALLARNMSQEAREMLFPATQLVRVRAALDIFEDAMKLDPNYFGSFAGASQASSVLAGISPEPETRERHLQDAERFAEQAVFLEPTESWAHSAKAFMLFVKRDYEAANEASLQALRLEPNNKHTLEIDAIIALFSGEFDRAVESAAPRHHENRPGSGWPWRNALGNTYFHTGDYREAIKHLTAAIRVGEPVSEINTAHLIASYQANGDNVKAAELVEAFENSWPDSRISSLLHRIFARGEDAENVLSKMRMAGWSDPQDKQ